MCTSSPENLLALSGDINERRKSVRYVVSGKGVSGVVCRWWAGVVQCHSHQKVMAFNQDAKSVPQIGTRFLR